MNHSSVILNNILALAFEMFKVLRCFALPVSLDHECQNITEIEVSNMLSVFTFRFETLHSFSGVSEAKTTSTRLELTQWQTFTDSPKNYIEMGNLLKCPWQVFFFAQIFSLSYFQTNSGGRKISKT